MKILVLGCARTATSALCQSLKLKHDPILLLQEGLSINFQSRSKFFLNALGKGTAFEQKVKQYLFVEHNHFLDSNLDYVIKFLGHHFIGLGQLIDIIQPQRYDQVHCIERKNVWHQICSHLVADREQNWLANELKPQTIAKQQSILSKQFTVDKEIVTRTAWDLCNYIEIKKYLIVNNIGFTQHYYEDEEFQQPKIGPYIKNSFEYDKMILNYEIGDRVKDIFYAYANPNTLSANYGEFCRELNKSTIFISDKVT